MYICPGMHINFSNKIIALTDYHTHVTYDICMEYQFIFIVGYVRYVL